MKKIILLAAFILAINILVNAQPCTTCDIATNGLSTDPSVSTITVGQTANLKFTYYNFTGDMTAAGTYPVGSVQVVLSLPTNFEYQSVTNTGFGGDFFNWTYDAMENALVGLNDQPIPGGQGEEVIVVIKAVAPALAGVSVLVDASTLNGNANIVPTPDGDEDTYTFTISTPLPVTFSNFEVNSKECALPELAWTTQSESNNKGFNIERSSDEGEYQVIGFVESNHNSNSKRDYSYVDKSATRNGNFKYRIDAVDFDGKKTLSDIVQITQTCLTETEVSVYPNPTTDRLTVYFEDKSGTNFEAHILDQTGKSALKAVVKANVRNIVSVVTLPEGVYNLQIERNGKITSKRFIKVN
jgi:hypothetical protein